MGRAVLKRLILADEPAELLALFEIVEGHLARARGDADKLRGSACAAGVQRPGQRRPAGVDLPNHGISVDLDIVKTEPRRLAAVDQGCRFDFQAARSLFDREQG